MAVLACRVQFGGGVEEVGFFEETLEGEVILEICSVCPVVFVRVFVLVFGLGFGCCFDGGGRFRRLWNAVSPMNTSIDRNCIP